MTGGEAQEGSRVEDGLYDTIHGIAHTWRHDSRPSGVPNDKRGRRTAVDETQAHTGVFWFIYLGRLHLYIGGVHKSTFWVFNIPSFLFTETSSLMLFIS